MKEFKKICATVLIVSMIFTSHAFFTFADSLSNNGTNTNEKPSIESVKDYRNASSSDAEEYDEENENLTAEYEEEPEEETTSVGASTASPRTGELYEPEETEETSEDSVGASEDSVGASTASPEEETTTSLGESEDSVGASTASPEEETTISVGTSEDSVGASTRPSELLSSESEESATKSPWGRARKKQQKLRELQLLIQL